MTDKEYQKCLDLGFNNSQINQIVQLNEKMDMDKILSLISYKTNVAEIRKLNEILRDPYWSTQEKTILRVCDLIKRGLSFESIIDKTISDFKQKLIFHILASNEISDKEDYIKVIKFPGLDDQHAKSIVFADINRKVNSLSYLKETFKNKQFSMAHQAHKNEFFDVLSIVGDMNPDFYDITLTKTALEHNIDIATLTNTQNLMLLKLIVHEKINGYDIDKFLNEKSTRYSFEYVLELLKRGYSEKNIEEMLNKYPFDKYMINIDKVCGYIDLVEAGIDPEEFLQREIKKSYIDKFLDIYKNSDDETKKSLLKKNVDFKNFELDLMSVCIQEKRSDALSLLPKINYPDEETYIYVEGIIKNDKYNKTKTNIAKIMFDKGNDVLNTFDECYEFNNLQKRHLARTIYKRLLSETQIETIRDNTINAGNMIVLTDMLINGYDINIPLKYMDKNNVENLNAIYHCMKIGLKFQDDTVIEK